MDYSQAYAALHKPRYQLKHLSVLSKLERAEFFQAVFTLYTATKDMYDDLELSYEILKQERQFVKDDAELYPYSKQACRDAKREVKEVRQSLRVYESGLSKISNAAISDSTSGDDESPNIADDKEDEDSESSSTVSVIDTPTPKQRTYKNTRQNSKDSDDYTIDSLTQSSTNQSQRVPEKSASRFKNSKERRRARKQQKAARARPSRVTRRIDA